MKTTLTLRKDYTTHIPVLLQAVLMTDGPILELGAGIYSTPLLHWMCAKGKRRLETFDNDPHFFDFANGFRSGNHRVYLVRDWDEADITSKRWSVALVDHEPWKRRKMEALRLKDHADHIILHDSDTDHYGYSEIYPHFRHIYHWTDCRPWTTVVSNKEGVDGWNL